MRPEELKQYFDDIQTAWKTLKPILENFEKSEAYIKGANSTIAKTAAANNTPYNNMLCLINQAELLRIGYGATVKISIAFPDGQEKRLMIENTDFPEYGFEDAPKDPFQEEVS